MQCPSCGRPNKPSARFCAHCGVLLDEGGTLQTGQSMDGGTYRIIQPLGKGGMGAVYLAANAKAFDRVCVIKEVIEYYDPANVDERRKAVERFESEARMLATLKHPGIPDIYAYFTEGERNYLVMEYIEGPNLAEGLTRERNGQIIQGRPLPKKDVLRYTIQICDVLQYLTSRQPPVMHNDIKPANIILDKNSGRAVLVDFGTAKTRYVRQGRGTPGPQQSSVYGTVGYAAPELYKGWAEPRSDVHALAATAYHLLTDDDPRAHPFAWPQMGAIPKALRLILSAALRPDVTQRPTAAEFQRQLEGVLSPANGDRIEAHIPAPAVEVSPTRIELGFAADNELLTDRASFEVRNRGTASATCRIEGAPPWLILGLLDAPELAPPESFACLPGQAHVVEMVGRVDQLPRGVSQHGATLHVNVDGKRVGQVRVVLVPQAGEHKAGSRLGTILGIGFASVAFVGAIVWFLIYVLPRVLP